MNSFTETAEQKIERLSKVILELETKLHQAMGALGYAVPGHIPEGDFKCGLCASKEKRIIEAEASRHSLYQVVKIFAETR